MLINIFVGNSTIKMRGNDSQIVNFQYLAVNLQNFPVDIFFASIFYPLGRFFNYATKLKRI